MRFHDELSPYISLTLTSFANDVGSGHAARKKAIMSRPPNHRRIVLAVFAFTAVLAGNSQAGLIFTQAGVSGDSSDGSGNPDSGHYQTYLTNFVSGGDASSASGSAFATSSSASVGLVGSDAGIHLLSSSRTSNFPVGYPPPGSEAAPPPASGEDVDPTRRGLAAG